VGAVCLDKLTRPRHARQRSGDERSMEFDSLGRVQISHLVQVDKAAGNRPTSTFHEKAHGTDQVTSDVVAP
jgi:hypothetical protein